MNQPMLAAFETQGLVKIVEEANKTFLRESHSLDRSSFNILRILSTFRLLYPQSPSTLYNAIIYITKNYDPQTYFQWKKAISQLSRSKNSLARIKSNYCRPDVSIYTKTYQNSFNRQRLNESCQHQKSKSYAQINIPQQISYSKQPSIDNDQFQKDASQTNAQTGKRQFYTKADSISHVSKNHYISFQPYRNSTSDYRNHFDKENINSTNIEESRRRQSAYQYIQAMQRDLNRSSKPSQVKTPIDQSFIKNMHNESPYLYTKTLQEIPDPIQQQMNARSQTFYQYNLKLKGFSSLQANCFVFTKAKQEEMKANIRHRSALLSKTFLGLNLNMKYQRNQKIQIRKAEHFYELSMMKKIFEVLKLIFILKREQNQNRVGNQFANRINLDFITTLLFTAGKQAGQDIIDFNKKINELLWSEQSSKLHMISKYFGKNSWMRLQNIQDLIKAYKKSLSIKVFSILRNQLSRNKKYDTVRQLNLKRFALFALKIKHSRAACYKQKIQTIRAKMDKSTMQKIMKSLIQMVYSNKLYSKKCEYIVRKHSNILKLTSLQAWNEKARQSLIEKNRMKKNIESLYALVQNLITKLCFRKILEKTKEIDMLTVKIQQQNINLNKIFALRNLKRNSNNLKEKKEISKVLKNVKLNLALKRWKQNTRKGKILNRIPKILRNYVFRALLLPHFQQLAEEVREKIMFEKQILKRIFVLLQNLVISNRQIQQERIKRLTQKLNFTQKQKGISSLTKNFHRQTIMKINENNLKKSHLLQLFMLKSQIKKLFDNCSNNKATRKGDQFTFNKIQQRLRYHKMTKIYRQLKDHHDIKRNMNKIRENVYMARAEFIYKHIFSFIIDRKINKVLALRKRNCSHSLSNILVQSYQIQTQKNNKASNHNRIILKYKCFEGLKDTFEKSKMAKKVAEKMIKRQIYLNAKEKLMFAIKETKIRKIAEKREIIIFFQNLQKMNQFKESRQKLNQITFQNMANSFFMSLQFHEEILLQKKNFNSSSKHLRKFIGINRLTNYFTAMLINRKHEYMALKFRALKLILCAFRGLQVKRVKKGHKELAERLSTDLVG